MKSDIVKLQRAEARARKVWERANKKLGKAKLVEKKARKAYDEAKGLRQSIEASLGDALKKLVLTIAMSRGKVATNKKKNTPPVSWWTLVKGHMDCVVATDFFTKPIWTLRGRIDAYCLFFACISLAQVDYLVSTWVHHYYNTVRPHQGEDIGNNVLDQDFHSTGHAQSNANPTSADSYAITTAMPLNGQREMSYLISLRSVTGILPLCLHHGEEATYRRKSVPHR